MKKITTLTLLGTTLFMACGAHKNEQNKTTVQIQNPTEAITEQHTQKPNIPIIENGEHIQRYPNGVIEMKGMMKDGKREGLWKSFYENGSPWSETTFKEGIKNGPTTTWYENEQKRYIGNYKDDKEVGKWTYWDEKGKLILTKDFDTE
ncbi:MAG: hypothetical protein JNL69_09590 [Bacteroidia bacterium]|nr:hypothetical protein [Bacteroidia bacterium]